MILLDNIGSDLAANYVRLTPENFFKDWVFLEPAEERKVRSMMRRGGDHEIRIKYRIVEERFGSLVCHIMKIDPPSIGQRWDQIRHEYNVKEHNVTHELTQIRNRQMGPVKYRAIKFEEGTGFVDGSVAHIWTQIPTQPALKSLKVLNILHFHINDCSDEVTID